MPLIDREARNTLRDPDSFYQALVGLHDGLDVEQSQLLNARLILLMAQHVGGDDCAHALLHEAARGIAVHEGADAAR